MQWLLRLTFVLFIGLGQVTPCFAAKVTDYPDGGPVQDGDITYIVRGGVDGDSLQGTITLGSTITAGILQCGNTVDCTNGVLNVTTTGVLPPAAANTVVAGPLNGSPAVPAARALVGNDLPFPSAVSIGGVESISPISHNWIRSISTLGVPSLSQPSFADISGVATLGQLPSISFSNLTSNISISQMNSGTGASSSTFWRGDGTWAVPPGGGGGSAVSSLTSATGVNSIDNAGNAQTWTWNSLTTQTAFTLSSSSITNGNILSLQNSAASATSTGKVLSLSDATTGSGYGVYSVMSGLANTGYAGYFSNTDTGAVNYALYAANSSPSGYAGYFAGNVGGTFNLPVTNGGNGWFVGPATGAINPNSKLAGIVGRATWDQSRKGASPFISSMTNNTPVFAGGFTKMLSGYAGNCCKVIRASDSAQLDIPFLADGIVDTNLMKIFAGSSTLKLVTWYDQSGNGSDATQATDSNRGLLDLNTLKNGAPSLAGGVYDLPVGVVITSTKNASAWSVVGNMSLRLTNIPFMLGTGGFGLQLGPFGTVSSSSIINGTQTGFGTAQSLPNENGVAVGLNSTTSAVTYYRNNYSVSLGAATSATTTGGQWNYGGSSFGGTNQSDTYAMVAFNAGLSASDAAMMEYGLSQSYSIPIAPKASVIIQGDSITVGAGGPTSYWWNYTKNLNEYIGDQISVLTFGASGQTLQGMVSETTTYETPTFKTGIPNIIIMAGGINDIEFGGASAATLEASITSWASTVHTAGFIAGMVTLYNRCVTGGYTSGMDTQARLLNTWILQNSGSGKTLDFAVDVNLEPTFNPCWNVPNDSADNLHPSIQGYGKVAPLFAQQISNVLYGMIP